MYNRENNIHLGQGAGAVGLDQLIFGLAGDQCNLIIRAVQGNQRRILSINQVVAGIINVPFALLIDP